LDTVFDARGGTRPLNHLLRALNEDDYGALVPHLDPVPGRRGDVLYEQGEIVTAAYFPCETALVSFIVALEDGSVVETATVGREGAVGGLVSLGNLPAFTRMVVQIPGPLLRIDLSKLEQAKQRSPGLANLFARYSDCLLAQVFQGVACNAVHPIEQRAARWLLATQDRVGAQELPITQEFLAELLGVGRTYLTRVMRSLKERDLIAYRRGMITIVDRARMEAAACECHAATRAHFETVLAGVYPNPGDPVAHDAA
jgi:CRP-like cAMP-binding protein